MKRSIKRLSRRAFAMVMSAVLGLGGLSGMTAQAAGNSRIIKSAFENAYNLDQGDTCYGSVELNGESETDSGTPNVWPTGNWGGAVNVTGYNWTNVQYAAGGEDIVTVNCTNEGGKLVITFIPGTKAGTTKVSVGVDAKYPHYSLGTWNMELNFDYTVTNTGSGSSTSTTPNGDSNKPAPPDSTVIGKFTNSTYGAVRVQCTGKTSHVGKISNLANHPEGYTLGEVAANDGSFSGAPASSYPWQCILTLNNSYWVDLFNQNYASKWGTHYLASKTGTVSTTFYSDGTKWYSITSAAPLYVYVAETAVRASYTVVHEYYTNDEKVGESKDTVNGSLGAVIKASDITKKTTYDGNTYTYTSAAPETLELTATVANNVVTLRYDRNADEVTYAYRLRYHDRAGADTSTDTVSNMPDPNPSIWENDAEREHTLTISDAKPTRAGYKFVGWRAPYISLAEVYQPGEKITVWLEDDDVLTTLEVDLYAIWEKDDTPATTSYRIDRVYLINGETKATVTGTGKEGTVGDEIMGADLDTENTGWRTRRVEGEKRTFDYAGSDPGTLTLTTDGPNVITLKYEINDVVEKTYTVIYKDGANGAAFGDESHGNLKEGDATPAFEGSTVRDGYTFQGWTPAIKGTVDSDMANDDGEIIYTATWLKNEKKITVTWKDGYTDDPIKVEKVKKGITDKELEELYPADPEREGYTFNGWGDPETDEDGNITITAKWKKVTTPDPEKVSITVEFVDEEGNVVKTETVEVDKDSKYDKTKDVEAIPEGYEANGEPTGDPVTGTADSDKTITVPVKQPEPENPDPEKEKVSITVEFVDEEGNVVKTETVEVDKDSKYDKTKDVKAIPEGYEANGEPTGDPVTGTADSDKTITVPVKKTETENPDPEKEKVTITVKFVDEDGNEVKSETTKVNKDSDYDVTDKATKIPNGYDKIVKTEGDGVKGTADTDKVIIVTVGKDGVPTNPPVDPKPEDPAPEDPTPTPEEPDTDEITIQYKVVYYRNHNDSDTKVVFSEKGTKSTVIASNSNASRKDLLELAEENPSLFEVTSETPEERNGYQFEGWTLVKNDSEWIEEAGAVVPWMLGDDLGAVKEVGTRSYEISFYAVWSENPEEPAVPEEPPMLPEEPVDIPEPPEDPGNPDTPDVPDTPSNPGGSGGGSSSGSSNGGGSSSDSTNGPGVTPDTVEIQPEQVPLSDMPEIPVEEALVQIDDDDVPLASLPKTGEDMSMAKMMLLLSGMLLGANGIIFKKKEEQD